MLFMFEIFVKAAEYHRKIRMLRTDPLNFNYFYYACSATDVTFQQSNCQSENSLEQKHFSLVTKNITG